MSPGEELPFVNNSYKVVMVLRTLWVLRENIDLKPLRAFSVTQHKMEKRIRVKIISLFILISLGVIFIAVGVLFHIKYQVGKYCFFETRPLFTQRCFWYSNDITHIIIEHEVDISNYICEYEWNEMNEFKYMCEKGKLWVVYGNTITIRSESISSYKT